ncbi:hypothetical protein JCM10213_008202 [Rhodosporidiobolus nylandii]
MPPLVPPAMLKWYAANYPTLQFSPDWLEGCVEYLQENDPTAATVPGLIKAVEVQLLSSDLSTSVVPSPATRAALATRYAARDKAVLFRGGTRKAGVLFQVVQVNDIAHSAGSTLETLNEKKEQAKLAARGLAPGAGGGRIMDLDGHEHEVEEEDEAKRKVREADKVATFARGSGKLLLSDGETQVAAFERERIGGLGLEEIKLGAKLLIHDVPSVNGILMLTPQNTTVKGFQVEEWDAEKEWTLENSLRDRLGMDLLPPSGAQDDPPQPPPEDDDVDMKPHPRHSPRPLQSEDYGDDFDYEAAAQAFEQDQGGGGGDVDEDELEAMRAMEDFAPPPPARRAPAPPPPVAAKSSTARRVKPEFPSSAVKTTSSSGASGASKTGLSGKVEVLDLASSGEDEDEDVRPKPKKVKSEPASSGTTGRAAPKKGKPVVLELDSDD